MLYLGEDESFSLSGNVTTPGYQRMVLKGFLVSERPDGTYVAPLIPQLFYGADGQPLQTWRQNITGTGSQLLLSRSGGLPTVPKQDLWWRKVSERKKTVEPVEYPSRRVSAAVPVLMLATGIGLYLLLKK